MIGQSWTQELHWVEKHIPETKSALTRFPNKKSVSLAVRFHIDLKMIPVIQGLAERLNLLVFPCHEDTTDTDGWAHLKALDNCEMAPHWDPAICGNFLRAGDSSTKRFLCDLGGEMLSWASRDKLHIDAALEGTTSGLTHIKDLELKFPILDWNNAKLKRELHNEKMVGFSLWQTFSEVTRLSLHGKTVGVLGFGPVGRGIARTARALGARVLVFDPCPKTAMIAGFEGFWAPDRATVLAQSQVLVTATGAKDVLQRCDLELVPSGCLLLNAGHSEMEWSDDLRAVSTESVLKNVEKWSNASGHHAYLLAKGRLLNLAAGFGDTINAFDITSAQLVDAIRFTIENGSTLQPGIHEIPDSFYTPCDSRTMAGGTP